MAETTAGSEDTGEAAEVPVWQPVIERARQAIEGDDTTALDAADQELRSMIEGPRRGVRRALPQLNL